MTDIINILKVRDDHEPIYFNPIEEQKYMIGEGRPKPNWFSGEELSINDLRGRIEPWLTSLFQSEHLSLLMGVVCLQQSRFWQKKRARQPAENFDSTESPQNGMGIPALDKDLRIRDDSRCCKKRC